MSEKWERAESENDPNRCQANGAMGQCNYLAIEGSKTCPRHTSGVAAAKAKTNYKFNANFMPRIDAFANNPQLKSLNEEVGLLRMILETIVNRCKNDVEIELEADRISRLIKEINSLIVSCHKLEEATGQVLSKTIVVNIGSMIVNILSKYIPDKDVLEVVGGEIYDAIEQSASPTSEKRALAEQHN